MNYRILELINGGSYSFGLIMAWGACAVRLLAHRVAIRSISTIVTLAFGGLVVLSATPVPLWLFVVWIAVWLAAIICTGRLAKKKRRLGVCVVVLFAVLSLLMLILELPYQLRRPIMIVRDAPFYVIGDSLSAGIEPGEETWPIILAKMTGLEVVNLAVAGDTVHGALAQAGRISETSATVLIEIGVNDVLGITTSRQFESDLQELLDSVCCDGRYVAMFELPLPPLCGSFGRAQRSLAREYGVTLIGKKCLAGVLAESGATTDGLHLSATGHDLLARAVRELLPPGAEGGG